MLFPFPERLSDDARSQESQAASPACDPACAPAESTCRQRRGATALEYLVMITFILVAMILMIQHFGSVVKGMFSSNSNATSKTIQAK